VTCFIELPSGYDVGEIDVGSLLLNGAVAAASSPTEVGDYDLDGVADRVVKFPRPDVIALFNYEPNERGNEEIVVTGLVGGQPFRGSDLICVINPSVRNRRVCWGEPLAFSVAFIAEGLIGDITFSCQNLPPGATIDPKTGWFSWTPPLEGGVVRASVPPDVVDYDVTFIAATADDMVVDTMTITLSNTTGIRRDTWNLYR
jgi:hypothetical protein